MAQNTKKIKYFKFSLAPPTKQPSWQSAVKAFILVNKAALIVLVAITILVTVFMPIFTVAIAMIVVVAIFRADGISSFFADQNARFELNERKNQRKYFAKINKLEYQETVSYESTIQIADTDNIAENYLYGQICGIYFWTGDTRYDYEVDEGNVTFHKTTITTIFLDGEVPNFQIIKRQALESLNLINLDYLFSNNYKLAEQFDKKYIFRMPDGYGVDAYYIFTPELLELIIKYDPWLIELHGEMATIHTTGAVETEKDYIQLAKLIQILGGKIISNTSRYQDWRSNIKKQVQKAGKKIPD